MGPTAVFGGFVFVCPGVDRSFYFGVPNICLLEQDRTGQRCALKIYAMVAQ